jgi:hypothetical protein
MNRRLFMVDASSIGRNVLRFFNSNLLANEAAYRFATFQFDAANGQ